MGQCPTSRSQENRKLFICQKIPLLTSAVTSSFPYPCHMAIFHNITVNQLQNCREKRQKLQVRTSPFLFSPPSHAYCCKAGMPFSSPEWSSFWICCRPKNTCKKGNRRSQENIWSHKQDIHFLCFSYHIRFRSSIGVCL